MRYLSEKLTSYVISAGAITKESYAIYQYGFQIGLEMLSCFLICLSIAIYLHMILQYLIITSIFMLLRTYAGGLHLNSYFRCLVCSVAIQTLVLLIIEHHTIMLSIAWGNILIGSVLIAKNAPVENINKELDKEEKKHCKKITMMILIGVVVLAAGCSVANMNNLLSLISLTVMVVLISQYIGMIKYRIEKKEQR